MYVQFRINEDLCTAIKAIERFYAIKTEHVYDTSLDILDAAREAGAVIYEAPRRNGRPCVFKTTRDRFRFLREITGEDRRTTSAVFQTAIRAYIKSRTATLIDHLVDASGNYLSPEDVIDKRLSRFRDWTSQVHSAQHAANELDVKRKQLALSDLRGRLLVTIFQVAEQEPAAPCAPASRITNDALARRLGVSKPAVTCSLRTLRARGLIAMNYGESGSYRTSFDLRPTIVWLSDVLEELHRPVSGDVASGLSDAPLPPLQHIPLPPVRMPRASQAERRCFIGFNLTQDVREALLKISAVEGVRLEFLYEQGARTFLEMRKAGPVVCEQAPKQSSHLMVQVTAELHGQVRQAAEADGHSMSDIMQTGIRAYLFARSRLFRDSKRG